MNRSCVLVAYCFHVTVMQGTESSNVTERMGLLVGLLSSSKPSLDSACRRFRNCQR